MVLGSNEPGRMGERWKKGGNGLVAGKVEKVQTGSNEPRFR